MRIESRQEPSAATQDVGEELWIATRSIFAVVGDLPSTVISQQLPILRWRQQRGRKSTFIPEKHELRVSAKAEEGDKTDATAESSDWKG